MNVRQKLSLAAMCIALPVLGSAQAAAPAPAAAPAFEFKAYGFLLLTAVKNDGTFNYPEYPSLIQNEDGKTVGFSARQSRIGWTMKNADSGVLGAKSLSGKLEFDFMGTITAITDSVPVRLRYAVAQADWAAGPGTFSLTVGQTDGLVNPLHPELGAYIALPTFMQAGNLTRRSPQIRVGYGLDVNDMVGLTLEAAALQSIDKGQSAINKTGGAIDQPAGSASGMPDVEVRAQAVVKPMADVKATVGVGFHTNKQTYDANLATEKDLTSTLFGVDVNVEATKYLNVRGEWFTGKGSDVYNSGAFGGTTGSIATNDLKENETTGFWAQLVGKPLPYLWLMAGYGQETQKGVGAAGDTTVSMTNLGVLAPVGKNLRFGLEYTMSKRNNPSPAADLSGSEIALSSRFSF